MMNQQLCVCFAIKGQLGLMPTTC